MMHVKYQLQASLLHGIGLFTAEDIKKGQLIYTASPLLDLNLPLEEFDSLKDNEKKEIQWWGFYIEAEKVWHVDFDVSKFINHSFDPTLMQDLRHRDAYLVATKELKKGEELTQNYLEFESIEDLKKRGIEIK